jgi:hypothetical protein
VPFATFPLYPPRADVGANIVEPPVSAKSDLTHRTKTTCYSITSSARASKVGGTSRPSAFAVVRFTPSWHPRSRLILPGFPVYRSARFRIRERDEKDEAAN